LSGFTETGTVLPQARSREFDRGIVALTSVLAALAGDGVKPRGKIARDILLHMRKGSLDPG
jgi:hypothetical protein